MDVEYLRRTSFLSLLAYVYGEPDDSTRFDKVSLIQLNDAVLPLDFDTSIGEQIRRYKPPTTYNLFNEYYNLLISSVIDDAFFDTMFLEANFQNKLGGECYIFRRGIDRYAVFRGSDTLVDVWIDVTIETVPLLIGDVLTDDTIRIHKGILEQMKNYSFIKQVAKSLQAVDGSHIYVIGHSLGAASAMLQGYYLHYLLKSQEVGISIVSVGGPAFGTTQWADSFNAIFCNNQKGRRFDRLINERDIIPNIHTLAYNVLDTIPLLQRISLLTDPPNLIEADKCMPSRFLNKTTFDYQHSGFDTWVIKNGYVNRVVNANHEFVNPTKCDVINIPHNHLIDYHKWLANKQN